MKSLNLLAFVFVLLLSFIPEKAQAADHWANCYAAGYRLLKKAKQPRRWALSKLEKEIQADKGPDGWAKGFKKAIQELTEENPALAEAAQKAWLQKWEQGGHTLRINFASLPEAKMTNFLEGPWAKVVGPRGTSEPFVTVEALNSNVLKIYHEGDKYPLLIEWANVSQKQAIRVERRFGNKVYRVLTLPQTMTEADQMTTLKASITELISASHMNPFIAAWQTKVMKVAAYLHDGKLIRNRPSQDLFQKLMKRVHGDNSFAKALKSLLYVAPTGTGKTRILGLSVTERIKELHRILADPNMARVHHKKVIIVTTEKPELVNQIAKDIGTQIHQEFPDGGYRIVQWGGSRSQAMKFENFLAKVEAQNEPVIVMTSAQSLSMRVKTPERMQMLMDYTSLVGVDEAHHAHQPAFQKLMTAAARQADVDRRKRLMPLPITSIGVTATPVHKGHRSVDLFDHTFWSLIDSPGMFANQVKNGTRPGNDVFEWVRVPLQISLAKRLGEITAPDGPIFVDPNDIKKGLESVFKVVKTPRGGHVTYVDEKVLDNAWKHIAPVVNPMGKGVVDANPRDSVVIAREFSKSSGKNFVALDPALTGSQRNEIMEAFRKQIPYEGKEIHGLVGPMREGLDFPFIGWYASMKRTVKFPEIVQGPGRAYRLSINKPTPAVLFFGEAPEAVAYRSIRNIVLSDVGDLNENLKKARAFVGRRRFEKEQPNAILGKLSNSINTTVEFIFRKNRRSTTWYGEIKDPSETVIKGMQEEIAKGRFSKHYFEVSESLKEMVFELNAFPFFRGNLEKTWELTDRLSRIAKKGEPYPKTVTPEELMILKDEGLMGLVEEFKGFKAWLGSVPRTILNDFEVKPAGIYELADTVNAFVRRNSDFPGDYQQAFKAADKEIADDVDSLADDVVQQVADDVAEEAEEVTEEYIAHSHLVQKVEEILNSSMRESFINRLDFQARTALDGMIAGSNAKPIETDIAQFFADNNRLPNFIFDKLDEGVYTHAEKLEHVMATRLQAFIKTGKLNAAELGPDVLRAIDGSAFYQNMMRDLVVTAETLKNYARTNADEVIEELDQELLQLGAQLNKSNIVNVPEFYGVNTLRAFAQAGMPNSKQIDAELSRVLRQGNNSFMQGLQNMFGL